MDILNRLLNTLEEHEVPGPQFFRLKHEFDFPLGEGGQGNIRGVNERSFKSYSKASKGIRSKWPVDLIAIKQHQRSKEGRRSAPTRKPAAGQENGPVSGDDLAVRFRAAECEVLTLSPAEFRGYPNIVQLLGWGLCLDTVEDPGSDCCGQLQLPLLILERADMNFEEFLKKLFPSRLQSWETLTEEGRPCGCHIRPRRPGLARSGWKFLTRITGFEPDPYETIRLLCIDIGHGLGCLHDHGFTHGDLKPENVLIFKSLDGWHAKLCDFGCSMGKSEIKALYEGTPGWLPPKEDLKDPLSYDDLVLCDLYVYGLVVWFSFCGRLMEANSVIPGTSNSQWTEAFRELQYNLSWGFPLLPTWGRADLVEAIQMLLCYTLVPRRRRSEVMKPWECLYMEDRKHDKARGNKVTEPGSKDGKAPSEDNAGRRQHRPQRHEGHYSSSSPLDPDVKSEYNEQSWWALASSSQPERETAAENVVAKCEVGASSTPSNIPQVLVSDTDLVPDGELGDLGDDQADGIGPASSEALDVDEDCIKTVLFRGDKRHEDVQPLREEMGRILGSWIGTSDQCKRLYMIARFRSRVPLEWWKEEVPSRVANVGSDATGDAETNSDESWKDKNFLDIALQAFPRVEISTLAWLCKGPIGNAEVKTLGTKKTWKSILEKTGRLDESERLDRFLLLIQFGARVEHRMEDFFGSTIFARFIESCRPATVAPAMDQVCQRILMAEQDSLLNVGTRAYFKGFSGSSSDLHRAAAIALQKHGLSDGSQPWWRGIGGRLFRSSSVPDEEQPLLRTGSRRRLLTLPPGWNIFEDSGTPSNFRSALSKGLRFWSRETTCFEDEFTQSVTITLPKVSLVRRRQVKVGFLNQPGAHSHVDLLAYHRGANEMSTKMDMDARFPYYDDSWFMTEWSRLPYDKDVLGELKDAAAWRLPSFSIRVPVPTFDVMSVLRPTGEFLLGLLSLIGLILVVVAIVALGALLAAVSFPFDFAVSLMGMCAVVVRPCLGNGPCGVFSASLFGIIMGTWLFYLFVGWTCPGYMHPEPDTCDKCNWILLTWWHCKGR